MTMKQTQTKLFDWSDVGLDFASGSKNLFPDRFKKMLTLGYNEKTVSSVSISGNQVTLSYGVSHGYVANRVLKIMSGALSVLNDGEFWIDSVTDTTLTLTIDNPPATDGGFNTIIASLGWSLVYESADSYIHIYKFKHIDNTDRYARLVFQSNLSHRNAMTCCIGKTYDAELGTITDDNAYLAAKSNTTPNISGYTWFFTSSPYQGYNNQNSIEGGGFGKCYMVGSLYHLAICTNYNWSNSSSYAFSCINGILPSYCPSYKTLDNPAILGSYVEGTSRDMNSSYMNQIVRVIIGNILAKFSSNTINFIHNAPVCNESTLPANINEFNTTTSIPLQLFENATGQFIGLIPFGFYIGAYSGNNMPSNMSNATPSIDYDSSTGGLIVKHCIGAYGSASLHLFFHIPVEGIEYGD